MKLTEKIEVGKRRLADYLNKASERLSMKTKRRLFASIGIITGCICLLMIVEPLRNPKNDSAPILNQAKFPAVIVPPDDSDPLFSEKDYNMLVDFKTTMDSLKVYDRTAYQEILNGREGLMDSITFLINLYR